MITGIGIDIVDVKRIKKIYNQYGVKFTDRILSEEEKDEFERKFELNSENNSIYIAGRFAAKESAAKALGTGISNGFSFRDFSVTGNPDKPELKLNGPARSFAGDVRAWISISHLDQYAIAVVVFEKVNNL